MGSGGGAVCVECTLRPVSVVMDLTGRGHWVGKEKAVLAKWWRGRRAWHGRGPGRLCSWQT